MIHSFPFYIADWRDSSARIEFSACEKLLYLELIIWCWKDGDLPTSEDALRSISGMTIREFRSAWKKVQSQFFLRDGRYHHHKVDERRPGLEEWREARVEAGKRGGRATAIAKAKAKAIAQANGQLDRKPSSSSSSERNPIVPFSDLGDGPEDLARDLWLMWPTEPENRRGALKAVMDELVAILSTSGPNAERDLGRIRKNAEAYIEALDNPQFCKALPNWLKSGEWTKAPKRPAGPVYRNADDVIAEENARNAREQAKWEAAQRKAGNA